MVDPEQSVCEKHVTLVNGEIHIYLIPLLRTPPHKTTIGCVIFFFTDGSGQRQNEKLKLHGGLTAPSLTWQGAVCVCVCVCVFSCVWLFVTPWARLLSPWDFPGKNTGVGCRALIHGISPIQGSNLHLLRLLHWYSGCLPLSSLGREPRPRERPQLSGKKSVASALTLNTGGLWKLLPRPDSSWSTYPRKAGAMGIATHIVTGPYWGFELLEELC